MEMTYLPRQLDDDIIIPSNSFSEDELKEIIRKMGLKVTQQRLIILKALHGGKRHSTAQEVFEKINKNHPEVGFATVYRFLRSLVDGRFVTETRIGGLPTRYELSPKMHHDHISCTKCGKICEFENRAIEALQVRVAQQFGFILTHHVLELYGICLSCQNHGNDKFTEK